MIRLPRTAASLFLAMVVAAMPLRVAAADSVPLVAVPRVTHPGAGQTFYFLLTDRFANGSTANDTGGMAGGPDEHGFDPSRISHFHGGDFAGLTARLDYLKQLGVTAVWVTPPFKNKPVQSGTAGYHGYWTLDFLNIDPHLGTNEEFGEFVRQAQARGLRVYMDIITNHTADVIHYNGREKIYRPRAAAPYRDAHGRPFDEREVAFNGLNDPARFPVLDAKRSFPHEPVVPAHEASAKNPAWLNDVTLYHNRGNTTFKGENAVHGDFVGLDDVFTEHPRVVHGFIDIFSHWLERYNVDGFRIDTVKHVNPEFWHAFSPAIRERARIRGRSDFLQFGEVYSDAGDPVYLSEFSTEMPIDTTLDFGFFVAARKFVSRGGTAAELRAFFAQDDYYTDHDSNVHATTTFLGNHDAGRFAYFLQQDNKGASDAELATLVKFAHGLLYLSRGQPVLYYGDEQGMIGRGGNDMQARESMFGSRARDFSTAKLLGTTRTGADDKFDSTHPFYRFFGALGTLRAGHAALRHGAMILRDSSSARIFAFSRIERAEQREYVVAFNNSRRNSVTAAVRTGQPARAQLRRIFDSNAPESANPVMEQTDDTGALRVTLAPLQFAVWRAEQSLPREEHAPTIKLVAPKAGDQLAFSTREIDGQVFPSRHELRADVGGARFAEVTFFLQRSSRPGQLELIGTDDAPPYRVFWRPPADFDARDKLSFIAVVSDLRGRRAADRVHGITVTGKGISFGIRGAKVPQLTQPLPREMRVERGGTLTLSAGGSGTEPLEFQWLREGELVVGATGQTLSVTNASSEHAGQYVVLVRNRAGTTVSHSTIVSVH